MLIMSAEENELFEMTSVCWICGGLIENCDNKVRDHCHISGKYRGAAHYFCNINLKISKKVPMIFHNLKGYNSHLIFKELSKFDVKVSVIPNGLEKYMAFTLNKNLVFIDSMLFMNSGLEKLVKNLTDKDIVYLREEFSGEQLRLIKEKGIYPYEYMNSFERFKENKLPGIDNFFSLLKDCGISEEESQRTCLEYYCLDPCHYLSSPGLSWDAMLKMTDIKLELISNIDIHLFIEKGIRGGISYIPKRYAKVDDNNTVMYWDANNLYCWVMIQSLPVSDFKFLISRFNLDSISENSGAGYILECDLEYCKELHDLHSDYPLCPEKIEVSSNMLTKYCSDIANK